MDLYETLLQSWIPDKRFALFGMTVLEIQRTNQAGAYFFPKGKKTVIPANAGIHNARDSSKNGSTCMKPCCGAGFRISALRFPE